MALILICGIFAYRRYRKDLDRQRRSSKRSMDDFKQSLMDEYAMDYGEDGEMIAGGAGGAMLTQEMLSTRRMSQAGNNNNNITSPKKGKSNNKKQPEKEDEEEESYDDEEEGDHGVTNEEREHL